jgi:hypothetical protein
VSFWVISVRLPAVEAEVPAPPEDVFAWVTSFTQNTSAGGSRVLSTEENGDLVCEFVSVVFGLLGRRKVHRTIERVTLDPPREVRFRGMKGPLDLLSDRFTLQAVDGGTLFRYESTVGLKGSVFGWLLSQTYVRVVLGRFMRDHVAKIRAHFETSA